MANFRGRKKPWQKKDDGLTEEERIAQEVARTKLPKGNQVLGYVDQLLGGKRMYVDCTDGKRRLCRVPGRAKRRVWVREGDYVIVEPWPIEGDAKGDVVWVYRQHQVQHLKQQGHLKGI